MVEEVAMPLTRASERRNSDFKVDKLAEALVKAEATVQEYDDDKPSLDMMAVEGVAALETLRGGEVVGEYDLGRAIGVLQMVQELPAMDPLPQAYVYERAFRAAEEAITNGPK